MHAVVGTGVQHAVWPTDIQVVDEAGGQMAALLRPVFVPHAHRRGGISEDRYVKSHDATVRYTVIVVREIRVALHFRRHAADSFRESHETHPLGRDRSDVADDRIHRRLEPWSLQ